MCRSIKTLREPYVAEPTEDDVRAAALQYVRKISGFRAPSKADTEAFDRAVEAVAAAPQDLLGHPQIPGEGAGAPHLPARQGPGPPTPARHTPPPASLPPGGAGPRP